MLSKFLFKSKKGIQLCLKTRHIRVFSSNKMQNNNISNQNDLSNKFNENKNDLNKYLFDEEDGIDDNENQNNQIEDAAFNYEMDEEKGIYPGLLPLSPNEIKETEMPDNNIATKVIFDDGKEEIKIDPRIIDQVPENLMNEAKNYQSFLNFVKERREEYKNAKDATAFVNTVKIGNNTFNGAEIPENRRIGEIDTWAIGSNGFFDVPVKRSAVVVDYGNYECNDKPENVYYIFNINSGMKKRI